MPQQGEGLGDLTVAARYWLFNPARHARGNVAVGAGIKLPTGADDLTAFYPTLAGAWGDKAIDQSAQPGDGGVGMLFDTQGYWRFSKSMVYGTVSYLANPRNTNGTPSILVGLLGPAANTPANSNKLVNSVADQYLLRLGIATQIPKARHFSGSLAFRAEGLNRSDVFGRSDGFRRPGYELYLEPGLCPTTRGSRSRSTCRSASIGTGSRIPTRARKATRHSPTTCSSAATRSGSARATASCRDRSRSRLFHRPR